jgi:hypothetical protein
MNAKDRPAPRELGAQYWETCCMICSKKQFAAVPDVICSECEQTSAVTDYIKKLEKALEPFSADDLCDVLGGNCDGEESVVFGRKDTELKIKHFRAARKVLKGRHYELNADLDAICQMVAGAAPQKGG